MTRCAWCNTPVYVPAYFTSTCEVACSDKHRWLAEAPCPDLWDSASVTQSDDETQSLRQDVVDPVNHPSHYADGWSNGAEIIDITEHLNFCRGSIIKYVARAGKKDPAKELEDLRKAAWYLQREIARLGADEG